METASTSSSDVVPSSESAYEDEDWWKGAEEVDLTLHFDLNSEDELNSEEDLLEIKNLEMNLEEEEFAFWNESSFEEMDCEAFTRLTPPPKLEYIHPPPLPPFLKDIGILFQESWRRRTLILSYPEGLEGLSGFEEEIEAIPEDGKCPLCEWSRGNNETLALLTRKPVETKSEKESTSVMIWALVGVALISASVGAVFMGLLLKCRRKDVINICAKTSADSSQNPQDGADVSDEHRSNFTGLRMALKNWRGCASQTSLDPYRSESVQNTYSESPYINGDSASTLYAEINNPTGVDASTAAVHYPSNTYSDAPDPLVSSSGLNVMYNKMSKGPSAKDGTYANSAYVLSEVSSEPNESSGGSTSTPSSAYYSDVSTSVEVHSSKKKKKKRKTDDRLSNIRFAQSVRLGNFPPSGVPPQQTHHVIPNQEAVPQKIHPPTQQFHSQSSLEADVPGVIHGQPVVSNISPSNNVPGLIHGKPAIPSVSIPNPRLCVHPVNTECCQPQSNKVQTVPLCPHFRGVYSDELDFGPNDEAPVQRPLPPLPSRQIQGPQRRVVDVNVHLERGLSAVPSEYI